MRVHIEITVSHNGETAERTIEYDYQPDAYAPRVREMPLLFDIMMSETLAKHGFTRRGSRDPE